MRHYRFAFFGTPTIAVTALTALVGEGLTPSLIITAPDRPSGRGMRMTPSPVKIYAQEHGIPCITPEKITQDIIEQIKQEGPWDFFVVVAYGKILKQNLLDIPEKKVINIHPSLLPKYRGPAPIEAALLSDDIETGVTVMEIDAEVDHGPIIAQEVLPLNQEITAPELETLSALRGAALIAEHIDGYLTKTLVPTPQDHNSATYTRKIEKSDGIIDETMTDWEKWKRYRAYTPWPGVRFFVQKKGTTVAVKINKARYNNNSFEIIECTPENGKPLSKEQFEQWLHQ